MVNLVYDYISTTNYSIDNDFHRQNILEYASRHMKYWRFVFAILWYIALLPTLIYLCTHILDTARSVTETKKNKTLANKIFTCRCVGMALCKCVCDCFNFLLSLETFAFTCVHLKFFFRPLQDRMHSIAKA